MEEFSRKPLMDSLALAIGSAFWLGLLTSISPCPLATNIAAISFVGRDAGRTSRVLYAGILYAAGRVLAYTVIGGLVVASVLSAPGVSLWLQSNISLFVGPLLVLVGMILLGLLELPFSSGSGWTGLRDRIQKLGLAAAVLLGVLFALSFCPVSAALFFGSLIPLAVTNKSSLLLPAVYGIGTGIPVIVFAIALSLGAKSLGALFQKVTATEQKIRFATGVVILLIGVWLTIQNVFL
jgi:cytochrome c-type biogenesis protein